MKRAAWREKAARDAIRARERAELTRLRLALTHAKAHRSHLIREARATCKRARLVLRERLKERRAAERLRLRREELAAREAERRVSRARRLMAKRQGTREVEQAKAELNAARLAQQAAHRAAARRQVEGVPRAARIHESDDAARRDIPVELQAVWDKHRNRFKSGGRRSRAEAFLEWAEENPGEVVAIQSADADREVARLVREHEAAHKRTKMRKTKAELARELAAVPF